jgi:hypothetical protein
LIIESSRRDDMRILNIKKIKKIQGSGYPRLILT